MPKINDIKIVRKTEFDSSKIKRDGSLLKTLRLNNIANTNDYYEKKGTEYPFDGQRTHRSKDSSTLQSILNKPKLLLPLQNYQSDQSRFLLDNTFLQSHQSQILNNTSRISNNNESLINNLISKKNIKIIDNSINNLKLGNLNGSQTHRVGRASIINNSQSKQDISYLKDQSGVRLLNQLNSKSTVEDKLALNNKEDKLSSLKIKIENSNQSTTFPTTIDEIQRILSKRKDVTFKDGAQINQTEKKTLQEIVKEISQAIQNPFTAKNEQSSQQTLEFQMLNLNFLKEVIPKYYSSILLKEFNNPFENKLSGEMFQDLFRKHNLEHLLKKDNLIFQTLSEEKSLKDARIDHLQNQVSTLGQPVNRKDAIILLRWLDTMMGKLQDLKNTNDMNQDFTAIFEDQRNGPTLQSEQKLSENDQEEMKFIQAQQLDQERLEMIQILLNSALKELIRQVSVSCIERGYALLKIFNAYLIIIQGMQLKYEQMKKNFKLKYRQKIQRVMSSYQNKREEAKDNIDHFNSEMAKIRNHYEELKISERLLNKQLGESKDQLEYMKSHNDELKEQNRKLYKDCKESKMQLQLLKKNLQQHGGQNDSDSSDQEKKNHHHHRNHDEPQKRKKKLRNLERNMIPKQSDQFDSNLLVTGDLHRLNDSRNQMMSSDNILRTQTDDDYSLLSQIDRELSKERSQMKIVQDDYNLYELYDTADKAIQVDERFLQSRSGFNTSGLDHINKGNTNFQTQSRKGTDLNRYQNQVEQKFVVNDQIKLFTNVSDTIQITDQSVNQGNKHNSKMEQAQRSQHIQDTSLNQSSIINDSQMFSVLNKLNNSNYDNDETMKDNLKQRSQHNILIQENQSFIYEDQPPKYNFEQRIEQVAQSPQKISSLTINDIQKCLNSIGNFSQQELTNFYEQLMHYRNYGNDIKSQLLMQLRNQIDQVLSQKGNQQTNLQKQDTFKTTNSKAKRNEELASSINNQSDDEIYLQKEINTVMYQDLMKDAIDSASNYQSFQAETQNITILQLNSLEDSSPLKLAEQIVNQRKTFQHISERQSSNNVTNLINENQRESFKQDKFETTTTLDQIKAWAHSKNFDQNELKKVGADRYKFSKIIIPGTTEFNEFHFSQKRKLASQRTHPSYHIYSKIQAKEIDKIKKVIPKKMVNKIISNIYSQRLDALLAMSEEHIHSKLYEFTYEIFIKRYGLKHVSEQKFSIFLNSVKKYQYDSFKLKIFSSFIGLSEKQNQDIIDYQRLNEDLIFYLGVQNVLNQLNMGNKIENLDTNDFTYFACVKLMDTLRYIFDAQKLNNDSYIILRKELDQFKLQDLKFNNRLGVFDFDHLITYLIPRWRQLSTDYLDITIKQIYSLLINEGQSDLDAINFNQFYLLVRSIDFIKKKRAESLFMENCSITQKLSFDKLKVMIQTKLILQPNNFIRFYSQKFDERKAKIELRVIKMRFEQIERFYDYEGYYNKLGSLLDIQGEKSQTELNCNHQFHKFQFINIETKHLYLILSRESKRIYSKLTMKKYFDDGLWHVTKLQKEIMTQLVQQPSINDQSNLEITTEQMTPRPEKEEIIDQQ
eukprot:403337105